MWYWIYQLQILFFFFSDETIWVVTQWCFKMLYCYSLFVSIVYPLLYSPSKHSIGLTEVMVAMVIKILIFTPLSSAPRWLPPGAALSVHWLAGLQRHASLQTLHSSVGQEVGQVAGAVWRRRWEDCGTLPVSLMYRHTHTQTHTQMHKTPKLPCKPKKSPSTLLHTLNSVSHVTQKQENNKKQQVSVVQVQIFILLFLTHSLIIIK